MSRFLVSILVASCASILLNCQSAAEAQCTGPNCRRALPSLSQSFRGESRLQAGQPVRNVARVSGAAVRGAARVASVPVLTVRKAAQFCQERKPARRALGRALRGVKNVASGNGPLLRRVRGRR
jgi:hypothetical protein